MRQVEIEIQVEIDIGVNVQLAFAGQVDPQWSAGEQIAKSGQIRQITRRVTVNPGVVLGGLKVNMVASDCTFEVDIRLPNGLDAPPILAVIDKIVANYPEVSYRQINYNPPSWCPPDTEMAQLVRANAKEITGIDPTPVISLGGTDTRLWRYKDIPAIVYGPSPTGMGSVDEHVTVEEFFHVVQCHVLC